MKAVVVGSMNLDLTITLERFPLPGETILGKQLIEGPGGKGSNQAAAIALAGCQVTLISSVGDDSFGRNLLGTAKSIDIDVSGVAIKPGVPTGLAVIEVDSKGENSIIVVGGANLLLDPSEVVESLLQQQDVGIVSVTLEIPIATATAALNSARSRGITTVLNASPISDGVAEIVYLADYLILNETELHQLTSAGLADPERAISAIRRLGGHHVIVTLGERGVASFDVTSEELTVNLTPAVAVLAKDTTGCGDAFAGALVADLASGKTSKDAIGFAVRAAAYAAMSHGAQSSYGTREQVNGL